MTLFLRNVKAKNAAKPFRIACFGIIFIFTLSKSLILLKFGACRPSVVSLFSVLSGLEMLWHQRCLHYYRWYVAQRSALGVATALL
jgi:hypothetical protein